MGKVLNPPQRFRNPELLLEHNGGNNFLRQPVVGTIRFQVNPGFAPLDNKDVRRAVSYAINREEIVNGFAESAEFRAIVKEMKE